MNQGSNRSQNNGYMKLFVQVFFAVATMGPLSIQIASKYLSGVHVFSNLFLAIGFAGTAFLSKSIDAFFAYAKCWAPKTLQKSSHFFWAMSAWFALLGSFFDALFTIYGLLLWPLRPVFAIVVGSLFGLGRLCDRMVYKIFLYGNKGSRSPYCKKIILPLNFLVGMIEMWVGYASLVLVGYSFHFSVIIAVAQAIYSMQATCAAYSKVQLDPCNEENGMTRRIGKIRRLLERVLTHPFVIALTLVASVSSVAISRYYTAISVLVWYNWPISITVYWLSGVFTRFVDSVFGIYSVIKTRKSMGQQERRQQDGPPIMGSVSTKDAATQTDAPLAQSGLQQRHDPSVQTTSPLIREGITPNVPVATVVSIPNHENPPIQTPSIESPSKRQRTEEGSVDVVSEQDSNSKMYPYVMSVSALSRRNRLSAGKILYAENHRLEFAYEQAMERYFSSSVAESTIDPEKGKAMPSSALKPTALALEAVLGSDEEDTLQLSTEKATGQTPPSSPPPSVAGYQSDSDSDSEEHRADRRPALRRKKFQPNAGDINTEHLQLGSAR